MKRNFTLALLTLAIGACSSDGREQDDLKMNLAAKWHIQEITYHDGESEVLSECQKQTHWTFSQDNKLYIREYSDKENMPCTDMNPNNFSLDYSLSDNTVTYTVANGGIDGGPYSARYAVSQLTSTTLKLTAVYEVDGITSGHVKYADAPFEGDIPAEHQWTFIFSKSTQD